MRQFSTKNYFSQYVFYRSKWSVNNKMFKYTFHSIVFSQFYPKKKNHSFLHMKTPSKQHRSISSQVPSKPQKPQAKSLAAQIYRPKSSNTDSAFFVDYVTIEDYVSSLPLEYSSPKSPANESSAGLVLSLTKPIRSVKTMKLKC